MRGSCGTRVIVAGPDGTGKTTVVRRAIHQLLDSTAMRLRHVHFDPDREVGPDPSLERLVPSPHDTRPRRVGQTASVVWRAWRYRRAARVGLLARHNVEIVVQERGWADQLVDPLRYRLSASGSAAARLFWPMSPRFDALIALFGDPPSLAARKSELSTKELARQIERWDKLRQVYPSSIKIDTVTNTVDDAVTQAISAFRSARKNRLEVVAQPVLTWPRRLDAHATPKANVALRALYKPASNVGKVRRRLVVKIPRTSHSVVVDMAARAIAEMDLPLDGFAVIQSKDRARAVVSIMREGTIAEFVKIGWGRDVAGLAAEANILKELYDTDRVRIPKLLGSIAQDGWGAIRLESLERDRPAQVDLSIGKVVDALVALRWSLHGRGVTHGDFRPWNLVDGPEVGIIDWEHARSEFKPGADLLDYLEAVEPRWPRFSSHPVKKIIESYASLCELDVDGLVRAARERGLIGAKATK